MKFYVFLSLLLIAPLFVGCAEKVGYIEETPVSPAEATPEVQLSENPSEPEQKINEIQKEETVQTKAENRTDSAEEVSKGVSGGTKPRFFSERKLVLQDSKAGLRSTADNLFIIYHENGDPIPVKYIRILVYRNGDVLDELRFDSDAEYFKGIRNKLKSSIIRKEIFEKGDEIIITERKNYNAESGEILGVKIVDSKWNITLLDSFVQVW